MGVIVIRRRGGVIVSSGGIRGRAGGVLSVNGHAGAVELGAQDVGADAQGTAAGLVEQLQAIAEKGFADAAQARQSLSQSLAQQQSATQQLAQQLAQQQSTLQQLAQQAAQQQTAAQQTAQQIAALSQRIAALESGAIAPQPSIPASALFDVGGSLLVNAAGQILTLGG